MTIPDFQAIMLPLLRFVSDGEEHRFRASVESLAEDFSLTDGERTEFLPSGRYPTFDSVVHIDGETLAELMIEHDVDTASISTYEIKRIDSDYFEEV